MDDLANLIKMYVEFGLKPADAIDKAREDRAQEALYRHTEEMASREDRAQEALYRHTEEMARIAGRIYNTYFLCACVLI